MPDLFADRASPLKHQCASEPDWTKVVQCLETHLSRQAGTPISHLLLEEGAREKSRGAEEFRSFATPLEAAQLRTLGVDRAPAGGRAEDAAAWVRMTGLSEPSIKLTLGPTEWILVHVAEETTSSTRCRARYLCQSGCDTRIGCLVRLRYDDQARGEIKRSGTYARPSSSSLV